MENIHSTFACGLPFYKTVGDETNLSIGLRTAAVALGSIAAIGGILALRNLSGISQIGKACAYGAIAIGGTSTLAGIVIKYEEAGHFLPKKAIAKIQASMKFILEHKEAPGIKYYNGSGSHRIFSVDDIAPHLIFKMHLNDLEGSTVKRYEKITIAKALCTDNNLVSLLIPEAKLFTVYVGGQKYDVIAEQKLDFKIHVTEQAQLYEQNAEKLEQAIRQFAFFICKTGYSDVDWRNNPIILDEHGNLKIALFDLEEWGGAEVGLYGKMGRRGLTKCLNSAQAQIVLQIAKDNGFDFDGFKDGVGQLWRPKFD